MRLSKLQKYILAEIYNSKSALPADFFDFYSSAPAGGKNAENKKIIQDTIHKSLDSLVAGDLLIAIGKKTAKKWFIHKVKLTNFGKKLAIKIIKNRQRKLPIK
ncbi:hypothetical protein HY797_03965 [Candidatus Falkowbacteria bacterium]|nr:hypothetical protein [Candidatus Falkowbacteria bacterium]